MPTAYADVDDIEYFDCTEKNDVNYIHPFDCTKFITWGSFTVRVTRGKVIKKVPNIIGELELYRF